jgi:hypothetical protein
MSELVTKARLDAAECMAKALAEEKQITAPQCPHGCPSPGMCPHCMGYDTGNPAPATAGDVVQTAAAVVGPSPTAQQEVPRWFIQVLEFMLALYPSTAPRTLSGGAWWEYLRAVISFETFPLAVQRAMAACDPMVLPSAELIRQAAVQVREERARANQVKTGAG